MTRTCVLPIGLLSVLFSLPLTAQTLSWMQVANAGPPARSEAALAFDAQRGRTILFGGSSTSGYLNDTWSWNGITWTLVAGSGPSPRSGHALAYDSQRGRTVLFGGRGASGDLADTWEWDGGIWTQVATTGPTARHFHALAYHVPRGRTLLFGGQANTGALGDTWEWDGAIWLPALFLSGPSPRQGHAMACDPVRGATVMFGGEDNNGFLGDAWEWNGGWHMVNSSGPVARSGHAMTFDSGRATTVLVGGRAGSSLFGDTWEWNGTTWSLTNPAGPGARAGHALTHDDARGRLVLFGGSTGTLLGDTWERYGTLSMATPYGSGCGNPALQLAPVPSGRPVINGNAQATLTNIPTSTAFMALGWSRTSFGAFPLPLTLAGFGMTGCDLLHSAEVPVQGVTGTGVGTALFSVPVPNNPRLIGLRVYLQGWAYAPGANPGNAIVSNAIEWVIGNS